MSAAAPRKKGFTGFHMILLMAGLFLVVGGVNAYFVYAAVTSWTGVVDHKAYESGLAYNDVLRQRERQAQLGWRCSLQLEMVEGSRHRVIVRLVDKTGAPLTGAKVSAELRRPTQEQLDRPLTFTDQGGGIYVAETEIATPGQWDIRIEAKLRGEIFTAEDRVAVKA